MRLKVTALLVLGLILVGCQQRSNTNGQSEEWYVSRVISGDTLMADRNGRHEEQIRLCGINAPLRDQPLGDQAAERLRELVEERYVALVPVERNQEGQLLAEIFVVPPEGSSAPEHFVQEQLLMDGLAWVDRQGMNSCFNREPMETVEAIAQEKQVGVWADDRIYALNGA